MKNRRGSLGASALGPVRAIAQLVAKERLHVFGKLVETLPENRAIALLSVYLPLPVWRGFQQWKVFPSDAQSWRLLFRMKDVNAAYACITRLGLGKTLKPE